MIGDGALALKVTTSAGRVVDLDVRSSRLVRAASALAGRSPSDVLRLVPLLFPVCGMAQTVACARAIESAVGRAESPALGAARELLCLAEAAASHVWQLAIAWREAAGVASDAGSVRVARLAVGAIARGLFATDAMGSTLREEPARDELRARIAELVALLDALTGSDVPLVEAVRGAGRAGFGASTTRAVATLDAAAVAMRLAADPAFAERPELDGEPVDPSAYARRHASPEVQRADAEHGRGLLTRLVARTADARADARRLASCADALGRDVSASPAVAAGVAAGVGVGAADTARGPLVFWVRATDAKVEELRVVAPTEWTFHPAGALHSSLVGAEATSTLARDAGWLVLALDPCVPWTIEVRHA
jgi:uptake hydrogenase large subunit